MNKINVCHFTNIITGKTDGVYAHLKMIFGFTDSSKFQQYLVFGGNSDIEAEVKNLGVKVHVIKSLNKKLSFRCFKEFYLFVKAENIEIIHTHFLKPYSIAGLVNILLRKKMIYNYHGLFIDNLYNARLDKFIYKRIHSLLNYLNVVNITLVPSYSSRRILMDETKKFKSIEVYYNGYDDNKVGQIEPEIAKFFEALKKTFFVIGIVARIDIQKRIDLALEIAKKLTEKNSNIYFVIMGDGPLEDEMSKKVEVMKLGKKVRMMGYVLNAKLYVKYFDMLLLTSDWEGFPLSIWEAMAARVPVVSTNVGGIKEILETEKCGVVYSRGDVNGAVKAILELISDQKKRKEMGQNGLNAIKRRYNSKAFADFFNNLYSSLST